jgi:type IV pilus assembly protein PilP
MEQSVRLLFGLLVMVVILMLSACGGDMDEMGRYIAEVKQRPGNGIEPLPQIKPYETFDYSVEAQRSPFVQERSIQKNTASTGPSPIKDRNKEYLEQFPLDSLNMVGTLELSGDTYGLVQTNDGLVHRVLPGNYVGQNDGQIMSISDGRIEVEELVPNGIGDFFKRSAGIGID